MKLSGPESRGGCSQTNVEHRDPAEPVAYEILKALLFPVLERYNISPNRIRKDP
jgi:hypothetical protein